MSRLLRMGLGRKSENPSSASPALTERQATEDEDEFHDTEEVLSHTAQANIQAVKQSKLLCAAASVPPRGLGSRHDR